MIAEVSNEVQVSLIICTRNRAAQLDKCLSAIRALKFDGTWEFVVVDNGSTDATSEVIKSFFATVPFATSYVYERTPGLGNARNAGLRAARGEIIAFTDDDCYVAPNLLQSVWRVFADPSIGFATGRILLHDQSDYPVTINESEIPLAFLPKSYLAPGAVKGANLAFRRLCLDEVEGFDPLFGSGALFPSEDIDTAARVGRRGWMGVYAPEMIVSHHHGRKAGDVEALKRSYDLGRGAYHAKLLLTDRAYGNAAVGWRGLLKRAIRRPKSLWYELQGAIHYACATMMKR